MGNPIGARQPHLQLFPRNRDTFYAACSDAHLTKTRTIHFDPMLKLFVGCPVMITENVCVEESIANGSMCEFRGVTLKDEFEWKTAFQKIQIYGYYVYCVDADKLQSLQLALMDDDKLEEDTVQFKIPKFTAKDTQQQNTATSTISTKKGHSFQMKLSISKTGQVKSQLQSLTTTESFSALVTFRTKSNTFQQTKMTFNDLSSNSNTSCHHVGRFEQMVTYDCEQNGSLLIEVHIKIQPRIYNLSRTKTPTYGTCQFPTYLDNEVTSKTIRDDLLVRFKQFPVNISHARTVHKLQGRSITYLLISSWNYSMENWIYVVLSRCRTLNGLHTRTPLDQLKTKGMSDKVRSFYYNIFRNTNITPQLLITAINKFNN